MPLLKIPPRALLAVFALAVSCFPSVSLAHHPLGGMTPENFMQGLLSGVGHPVIGLDHLAFIIAAGVLGWKLGKPLPLLGVFIAATIAGSLSANAGFELSIKEPLILLSLAVVGLLLIRHHLVAQKRALLFCAVAGVLHGAAYGEAIVGAEPTPLIAYLIGFAAVQFAIAFAASQSFKLMQASTEQRLQYAKITGALALGVAMTYGFEIAETAIFSQV